MHRIIPQQQRAQATIAVTLEATAQLLERSPDGHLTTNQVAERAGLSVGTIYRYFANKDSIFEAMIRAELTRQEAEITARLADPAIDDVEGFARIIVRAALRPFDGRYKVRRALMLAAANRRDLIAQLEAMLDRLTVLLIASIAHRARDCRRIPPEAGRHGMLRAVLAATRSAALHKPELLATPAFEAELVRGLAAAFRA